MYFGGLIFSIFFLMKSKKMDSFHHDQNEKTTMSASFFFFTKQNKTKQFFEPLVILPTLYTYSWLDIDNWKDEIRFSLSKCV